MITIRWERNGSKCYDGRSQDILPECIVEEDRQREVGESVQVEWGRQGRLWNAVILKKQPKPDALELALPAKRVVL